MKPKHGKSRSAAMKVLLAQLREARQYFFEGDDGGREGAAYALNAVSDYLLTFEEPSKENLVNPLVLLSSALMDLDDGVVAPMLKTSRQAGRQAETMARKGLRAHAVFTLERLRKTGLKRDGAAKLVAKELNKCGVQPRGGKRKNFTANTIINWRNSISADFGKGFAAEALKDMKSEITINPNKPQTEIRADLLKRFRAVVRGIRAADEILAFPKSS